MSVRSDDDPHVFADAHAYGLYQALPLAGSDPDGITDAELYLKQVRDEASRLPFVVTSSTPPPPHNACTPVAAPVPASQPADPDLLPDAAWVPIFLAQFDALRTAIIQGAAPDAASSVSSLLERARVDGDPSPPTTQLLQGLDHLATLRLLRHRVDRLCSSDGMSTLDAQWLFGLLARLELPVDPDTGALLQRLQRHLIQLRAGASGRHDPMLPQANLLLVAIGARFGQDEALAPLYGS